MKTKHIFGLVVAVALTGFAASAQAGMSVNFSFGAPVLFTHAVVAAPCYAPPVAYCPPPVVYCPPPVVYYAPRPVYYAPRYERYYDHRDYRGHGRDRDDHGRGHDDHGRGNGGRR